MTRFLSIILILYSQYINLQWAHIHTAATVLRAALIGSHCRVACWDHSRPITYNISEKNLTFKWVRYILELSSYTSHVILVMRHRIEYQECLSVGSYLKLLGQVWCVYILGKGTCKYPLRKRTPNCNMRIYICMNVSWAFGGCFQCFSRVLFSLG